VEQDGAHPRIFHISQITNQTSASMAWKPSEKESTKTGFHTCIPVQGSHNDSTHQFGLLEDQYIPKDAKLTKDS